MQVIIIENNDSRVFKKKKIKKHKKIAISF